MDNLRRTSFLSQLSWVSQAHVSLPLNGDRGWLPSGFAPPWGPTSQMDARNMFSLTLKGGPYWEGCVLFSQ